MKPGINQSHRCKKGRCCSELPFIIRRKTDLISLWKGNLETLESFRREHFSFIFQNNYLMPNLTAGENMMLTLLMKGEQEEVALKKIKNLMKVVRLSEEVIDKSIYNVSGGQKQRLAFVRAIASPYEILVGDEPTGNLDAVTAQALMKFTRNAIISNDKAGIFVSHDINLALKYADRIYIFTPKHNEEGLVGFLSSDQMLCLKKGNWTLRDRTIDNPMNYIQEAFEEII
ncbi:MAG: ATP-binding cassette domain-containing protein [Saprospiraceae bacterium]|nr:ATP-binding cassette domain-containing protein [Saprospiraceae bacterium]